MCNDSHYFQVSGFWILLEDYPKEMVQMVGLVVRNGNATATNTAYGVARLVGERDDYGIQFAEPPEIRFLDLIDHA